LWDTAIKNFNTNPTRRIDVTVGIGYGDSIDKAIETARAVVGNDGRILQDPAADYAVTGLGDSAVDILVRVWCKREDYWGVLWDLNRNLKEAFDQADVDIPFPQRTVHMVDAA
jgi:small conductance mechanosensitive channel